MTNEKNNIPTNTKQEIGSHVPSPLASFFCWLKKGKNGR